MRGEQVKELIDKLSGLLGAQKGVQLVFGDTRAFDDRAVIPVARVGYGFGGGAGACKPKARTAEEGRAAEEEEGLGFGGGVNVKPIGYIEVTPERIEFRPIIDLTSLLIAAGVAIGIAMFKAALLGRKRW